MPGDAFVAQPIVGFGIQAIFCVPSSSNTASPVARSRIGMPISTMHMRQLPAIVSLGW